MSDEQTIVDAARAFLKEFANMDVPEGNVYDIIMAGDNAPDPESLNGARQLIRATGEFIDLTQEMDAIDANAKVVQRLQGKGPDGDTVTHIGDMITNIAIGDDVSHWTTMLRATLEVDRGENLFDAAERAVKNILRDKKLQVDDNLTMEGRNREESDEDRRKRDEGTWRQSTHATDDEAPDVSDDDVRRAAQEHDKEGGSVNDRAIERSANEGVQDISGSNPTSDYEARERREGLEYLKQGSQEAQEAMQYGRIAILLRRNFEQTLGKALEATKAADREVS